VEMDRGPLVELPPPHPAINTMEHTRILRKYFRAAAVMSSLSKLRKRPSGTTHCDRVDIEFQMHTQKATRTRSTISLMDRPQRLHTDRERERDEPNPHDPSGADEQSPRRTGNMDAETATFVARKRCRRVSERRPRPRRPPTDKGKSRTSKIKASISRGIEWP
jgi:hypothetical protein